MLALAYAAFCDGAVIRTRLLMCENSLADAGRCRALQTQGARQKSVCFGRYKCKRVKSGRRCWRERRGREKRRREGERLEGGRGERERWVKGQMQNEMDVYVNIKKMNQMEGGKGARARQTDTDRGRERERRGGGGGGAAIKHRGKSKERCRFPQASVSLNEGQPQLFHS